MLHLCHPTDQHVPCFTADRVKLALAKLAQAADKDPADYACEWLNSPGLVNLKKVRAEWRQLANDALQAVGKVTVRYLGDLKESSYPLSVRFFHAKGGEDDNDFQTVLKKAILATKGERKFTFVNLANVREIAVDIGAPSIPGIQDDIAFVERLLETIQYWDDALVKNI